MRFRLWLVGVLIFTACVVFAISNDAAAQAVTSGGWSIPENLSSSLTSSSSPAIVADQFGLVHVFWSEDLGGTPHDGMSAPGGGNAIMYRQRKDGLWSDATDIFYGGRGVRLDSPAAVVDSGGNLHLVWTDGTGLEYSFARASDATRVKAWSRPVELASGFITQVRLLDMGDRLLAIYNVVTGNAAGLYSVTIKGDLVLSPDLIWSGSSNAFPQDIGVAKDRNGRVHVVWSVSVFPNPAAVEVRYTYSEDESGGWAASRLVAKQTSDADNLQFAVPWVAVRGVNEVHLQWAQGDKAYRSHEYSTDGGKTWTAPERIWPDYISQTNSQATGVDSAGTLYWADVLRFPNAGYLIAWGGNEWQRPVMFYLINQDSEDPIGDRINVHEIKMAISLGKEIYLAFQDQDRAEVYVMHRTLAANEINPIPLPTSMPVIQPTQVLTDTTVSQTFQGQNLQLTSTTNTLDLDNPMGKPGTILLAGVLPVLFILSILAIRTTRKV